MDNRPLFALMGNHMVTYVLWMSSKHSLTAPVAPS